MVDGLNSIMRVSRLACVRRALATNASVAGVHAGLAPATDPHPLTSRSGLRAGGCVGGAWDFSCTTPKTFSARNP